MHLLFAKWSAHIIWVLGHEGAQRFGELKRRLDPISTKTLTERLRELEAGALLHRDVVATIPPQVTYSLTSKGVAIFGVVDQLVGLAEEWEMATSNSPTL
ncbi:winged helix-turn-helix transcriptional regulator [Chitinimonas sp. BJB300]|uniref:winged helix-turn-helix transcriptional regulator n=1 Tax=Chitinimonas sp. BJB300 TaxID=1559339 RepID=UPI000C111EE1|nr:helix-turn-helix domain-containing protein [Chitinimonas sp. BJB300]PHV11404.1 transcriptional regulator [Chitinimonas sp. BJB300]TSJ91002.1 helix-turn-helix transcriptional regulator [Chitinimonas sp. BJB300]